MLIIGVLLLLGLPLSEGQCQSCNIKRGNSERFATISYTESTEHIENPERGFMQYTISASSDPKPLTREQLDNIRSENGMTVIWRQWKLDTFVESDISQDFLDHIRQDFLVLRDARFSAVVRFMYTSDLVDEAPYGDAEKSWILRHIEQLRDILFGFEDIIVTVQAGFIGTWGEWYYTTYFGDPDYLDWGDPDNVRGLTPENWQDRHDVLNALLENIPPNVTVEIRYPQTKYHLLQDTTPTVEQDMKDTNKKYRISHHNDCFLSSPNDVGTYIDFEQEYPYLQQDLLYSNIGGETCRIDEETNRHVCSNALVEMRELRYTYLNNGYNRDVIDIWVRDGCYEPIHRDMAYRLVLKNASLPDTVTSGDVFCFTIVLENVGFAAPVKNRDVVIIFMDSSGTLYSAGVPGADVRTWLPGSTVTIRDGVTVPLAAGSYQVYLAIKPYSSFETSYYSDYNILMANIQVPDYVRGLNSLQHTVQVTGGEDDQYQWTMICPPVLETPQQVDSVYNRRFCQYGQCDFGNETECIPFTIMNPSFEETDVGWFPYQDNSFEYTTETASHGIQSIKIRNGGAGQTFNFPEGTRHFTVTTDSKNEGVTDPESRWYSIYCDVKFTDDSWSYGEFASFTVGNSEWHTAILDVDKEQDISQGWCYAMFLDYTSGTAHFDHFRVTTCPQ